MFDSLMLMSQGQCMYFGPAKEAVPYFDRIGYTCPTNFNPSDFFIDLISVVRATLFIFTICSQNHQQQQQKKNPPSYPLAPPSPPLLVSISTFPSHSQDQRTLVREQRTRKRVQALASHYESYRKKTPLVVPVTDVKALQQQQQQQPSAVGSPDVEEAAPLFMGSYAVSYGTQLYHLFNRAFRSVLREKVNNIAMFAQTVVFAILLGCIWLRTGKMNNSDEVRAVVGALFFILVSVRVCFEEEKKPFHSFKQTNLNKQTNDQFINSSNKQMSMNCSCKEKKALPFLPFIYLFVFLHFSEHFHHLPPLSPGEHGVQRRVRHLVRVPCRACCGVEGACIKNVWSVHLLSQQSHQ